MARNVFNTPIGVLLSILSLIILVSVFVVSTKTRSFIREGFEYSTYKVKTFVQDGCSWCDKFAPVIDDFASKVSTYLASDDGKVCAVNVAFEKISMKTMRSEFSKYNITSTPTTILTDDKGDVISTFKSPSTCQGLADWLSSAVKCDGIRMVCK